MARVAPSHGHVTPVSYKNLLGLVIALTVIGLIVVGSASVVAADRDFGNKWFYLRQQAAWALLGLVGMFVATKVPISYIKRYTGPLLIVTLTTLLLVLIPGIGLKLLGARRWINLGFFSFQPAELAKLTLIIYFAKLFEHSAKFSVFLAIAGGFTLLIMLEPDMGTSLVIMGISICMYLGSNGSIKPLMGAIPIGICLLLLAILISPYRLNRVKTFLNSSHDPLGSSYQVRQSLISLGSGGIFGQGIGQSRQKYEFLPEVTTDSVFAVVGEEIGFLGSLSLLGLFGLLALSGLQVAKAATDRYHSLLALGIASWFGLQSLINISAVVALVPFTGIPLSFVSYGGTSLLITLTASGMLINIAKSNS